MTSFLWYGRVWMLVVALTAVPGREGFTASARPRELAGLTQVAQIRHLTAAEAAGQHPVSLRAVVTYAGMDDDGRYALFVQDASSGIFVHDPRPDPGLYRAGQEVELEGVSDPGLYGPVIRKGVMRVVGEGRMPLAKPVTMEEMLTGRLDGQRVRVTGVVGRIDRGTRVTRLQVLTGLSKLEVVVATAGESGKVPGSWLDSEVAVSGVCAAIFNQRRQLSGVALFVRGVEDTEVLREAPADPFDVPARTITSLRQFDPAESGWQRVRVPGVITLRLPGRGLFLQDTAGGLFVETRDSEPLEVGDEVEVLAYLRSTAGEPQLLEPRFRRLRQGEGMAAESVEAAELGAGQYDKRLVRLEAKLVYRHASEPRVFRCRSGSTEFDLVGVGSGVEEALGSVEPGIRARVTGVWVEERDGYPGARSVRLMLRSMEDFEVLERPSWWNSQRTLAVMSGLLVGALAAVVWAWRLKRQVVLRTEQTQQALALLEASVEQSPSGILIVNAEDMSVRRMNAAALAMRGTDREPLTGLGMGSGQGRWQVYRPDGGAYPAAEMPLIRAVQRGEIIHGEEMMIRGADGRDRWVVVNAAPVRGVEGRITAGVLVFHDITERKTSEEERGKLQAQLLQAQKMESVGRLAGGVAHDFNNMLQTILGNADLALSDLAGNGAARESLMEIRYAATRSADLVKQLLAFARKQTVSPRLLDLNVAVTGTLKMLQRLLGEDIRVEWEPGEGLWPIRMDPSQLDQVLANLSVNARDAIRGVGRIGISTANVTLDEVAARAIAELVPGDYVRMRISDTGMGMSDEVLEHLFEPFFTTKEVGRGTGLGLATVYGILRQNGGAIGVESRLGEGSVFTLYFPRAEGTPEAPEVGGEVVAGVGRGTILLVEDEDVVLTYCRRVLHHQGYEVLAVGDPRLAIDLVRRRQGRLDLLITDVVMPEMNGRELWDRLQELRPGLKCLFMSGYTADAIAREGVLEEGIEFLQKPFTVEVFMRRIAEILNRSAEPAVAVEGERAG